jgi:hypothetical protein
MNYDLGHFTFFPLSLSSLCVTSQGRLQLAEGSLLYTSIQFYTLIHDSVWVFPMKDTNADSILFDFLDLSYSVLTVHISREICII